MKHNNLPRYRLIVAYDGTGYGGWQKQQHDSSIAGTLEDSFRRVFNRELYVQGASRTDAGVHALGQVAMIKTPLIIDPQRMQHALNNILPPSITIRSIDCPPSSFNLFANIQRKIYYYHFSTERTLPFLARYVYYYHFPINFDYLRESLALFKGTHDFRSFCTGDDMKGGTVRTVDDITLEYLPHYRIYRVGVYGEKFLRYMIRRLVGSALEIAAQPKNSLSHLYEIFHARNPQHHLPTAPAHGLLLRKIIYQRNFE